MNTNPNPMPGGYPPQGQPYRAPVAPPQGQPYPPPGYAYPRPPAPPKKFPVWAIVLITVGSAAVLLLCGVGFFAFDSLGGGSAAKPTARVTGCNGDQFATRIDYTLTNHDSRTHTYYVHGTVGHSPAVPDVQENVAPGETVTGQVIAIGAQGDCEITGIDQR